MPARTLDAVIQENLGIKEMVLMRLLQMNEDKAAQIEDLTAEVARLTSQLAESRSASVPALPVAPRSRKRIRHG